VHSVGWLVDGTYMTGHVMGDGDLFLGRGMNARFATKSRVSTMFPERSVQCVPMFILRDETNYTICHRDKCDWRFIHSRLSARETVYCTLLILLRVLTSWLDKVSRNVSTSNISVPYQLLIYRKP
jgi:hypothetical protein